MQIVLNTLQTDSGDRSCVGPPNHDLSSHLRAPGEGLCPVPRLSEGDSQSTPELCPWRPHFSKARSAGSVDGAESSRLLGKSSTVRGRCDPQEGRGAEDRVTGGSRNTGLGDILGAPPVPRPRAEASLGPQDNRDFLQEVRGGPWQPLTHRSYPC